MSKLLFCCMFLTACFGFVGCGGSVDEVPALTEPGTDPSPEEQKNWREESMKRGGPPAGYKAPKTN